MQYNQINIVIQKVDECPMLLKAWSVIESHHDSNQHIVTSKFKIPYLLWFSFCIFHKIS